LAMPDGAGEGVEELFAPTRTRYLDLVLNICP
jgi:hypothetical protein